MARRNLLQIALLTAGLLGAVHPISEALPPPQPQPTVEPPRPGGCTAAEIELNECEIDPETGEVRLGGSETSGGEASDEGYYTDDGVYVKTKPDGTTLDIIDAGNCVFLDGECIELPGKSEPATPETLVVTLTDVEQYKPANPYGVSQPDGWGLLDKPVNFVISAEPHIVTGNLLGRPADVRFTPLGFRIHSSDGAVIESAGPGYTWEDLGQEDFTETPTSHVFTERGTYTLSPTVVYMAEYRFDGSGWMTVPGVLSIPGEPSDILIGTIETVLVPNPGER